MDIELYAAKCELEEPEAMLRFDSSMRKGGCSGVWEMRLIPS